MTDASRPPEDFPAPGPKSELERGDRLTPRFDAHGLIAAVATDGTNGFWGASLNSGTAFLGATNSFMTNLATPVQVANPATRSIQIFNKELYYSVSASGGSGPGIYKFTNATATAQSGTVTEGQRQFNYTMRSDPWSRDPSQNVIRQLSVEVKFTAQNRDYSVRMSTLVDSSLQ